MIIFVATVIENSKLIDTVSSIENVTVLHPYYDFSSDIGSLVLQTLSDPNVPKGKNTWDDTLKKDVFCIQQSDLVIYDLDHLPGDGRYLCMAATLGKNVIGVSDSLNPISAYYSASVAAIIKPNTIRDAVKLYIKNLLTCSKM
jgi:hypothetical protein